MTPTRRGLVPTVGMKEIAARLGVSKTTVHRALMGKGRISESTRERILAVAKELDYTPNTVARSLRRQRTGVVGVITTGGANSFYAGLLAAIEEVASTQGLSLLFCTSTGHRDLEGAHLKILREKRVDGLLVAPSHPSSNIEHYQRLQRAAVPYVFLDRYVRTVQADAVMTDHRLAGQLVAEHLLATGRRHLGVIMPLNEANLSTSIVERVGAFCEVVEHSGAAVVRIGRDNPWEPLEDYGAYSMGMFLDAGGQVDAVFGVNDHYALGAIWACRTRGLDVPQDVAVVGYDDLDVSSFVIPSLTSIRQPTRQIAWEAVKLLVARMGGVRDDWPSVVRLRPILMERDSSPTPDPAPRPGLRVDSQIGR